MSKIPLAAKDATEGWLGLARRCALALMPLTCVVLVSCGGGGGSGPASTTDTTRDATPLSVTSGYAPVTASNGVSYGDGGGDGSGGSPGGDGGGAGAGGDGGAFVNAVVTVVRADGTVVGTATTDAYGMVSVKNNGDNQPLLFTLQGAANATYWDEARQAQLPFPATQVMHAMVAAQGGGQTLSKNVGITPLTEAAYQYAVANLGGASAWKSAANIAVANQAVAAEFNRFLPSTESIGDITRLAAPSRDATTQLFAAATPNNTYGLAMAALVRQSTAHNADAPAPGLGLIQQIALDLSDGRLDGVGPGNVAVAPSSAQQAYVTQTLNADVLAAQTQVAVSNGTPVAVTTFTLGGGVSGLTVGGLVLRNGGATVSIPANATSFGFGALLVAGSTYDVKVETQPAGAVCTVANGSGTAGAANVTTPAVTCLLAPFTLGGSVAGLTTSGLVLANGSATAAVVANATSFTFGAVLVAGSTYNVTVRTQPAGGNCTVANGSGTAGAANVTTPVVTCRLSPFSLGGTVSGLTTTGLVLANGSATTPVAANATSFTFGAVLVSGSPYNVTVQTQPPNVVCTVSNGTGTAGSSDVTTPAVTCIPASFTLGGNVTGLTTAGLVLANGTATTTVAANAPSFTFGAVLVSGSTYNVTVQTQPTGLFCSVTDGAGTTASTNVANVQITCASPTLGASVTVSGLPAPGLVINVCYSVNNCFANFFFNNGTSSLPNVVPPGAAFTTSVTQQPDGTNCSVVSGGSGTASSTLLISISCQAGPNDIGTYWFRISGVTSPGAVVGVQYVPLAGPPVSTSITISNTTFGFWYTFAGIPHGASYSTSINVQPPGQTCVITGGSGTMSPAFVPPQISCAARLP